MWLSLFLKIQGCNASSVLACGWILHTSAASGLAILEQQEVGIMYMV